MWMDIRSVGGHRKNGGSHIDFGGFLIDIKEPFSFSLLKLGIWKNPTEEIAGF